jgi:hypothetical protein
MMDKLIVTLNKKLIELDKNLFIFWKEKYNKVLLIKQK